MAARAAQELENGMYVKLGIGIPTLVANYVGDKDITLRFENGMLGMDPFRVEGDEDPELINASKQTITEQSDLANWMISGKLVKGMGGAMDLVASVGRVVAVMDHQNKKAESNILKECSLLLTGKSVVDLINTNLGLLEVNDEGLHIIETNPRLTHDDTRAATGFRIV